MPVYALAAPLVPPSGFSQPLPHTASGGCVTLPAPYTDPLTLRSKYEGSDSARATLNPDAELAFRNATKPIVEFERGISEMVWRYKKSGDPQTLTCLLAGFSAWANAGALLSRQTSHTGRAMRKWALATLASSWLELKFMPGALLQDQQATERWLGQLAERVVQEWDGLPLKKTNNHSYWAAWAVMATAVALDRRDLFAWSIKEYRIAAGQIAADGTLPNEQKRGARALDYHNYALQPLVMIASFARANNQDVMAENNGALARLAGYVLREDDTHLTWLEPWCAMTACSDVTLSRLQAHRPLQDRRLGGNLTVLYQR
ncbi:mannuronate-specific alginate lyase [Enterobacteriaceae bacterium H4N4]|uniref:Mannuronate-specific alginate lyase n=1 Tax=Silvania confinis TaxID=2926470 RepID=A0A9J6QL41_9ENTR|nr:mannuronate-specific alginate lyase [Silvania confinis]MCU6671580.1 mannuronate-specific alginate lyase [Silvania confinis]